LIAPPSTGVVRGIRRWDLVALAINGTIGAGIFGLPARVFSLIGPYSLVAFAACALVVSLIILSFAEVGSRFSESGGPYLYARAAFGPVVGFQVGWLQWLARLTAFAANANLLVDYLGYFWPAASAGWPRAAIIGSAVALLTAVNIRGVRNAARLSNVFTIGKLLPLAFFVVAGVFFLRPESYSFAITPAYGSFSKAVLLLIFAFTGFEMAVIPAGEVDDPQRNLPRALLTALGIVTVFYLLIQVVCVGTLPGLATSTRPLADAASRFLGQSGATVILAGAVISITGNLNVLILAGSRLPFAMAEQRQLPRIVGATHPRFRTPYVAILLTATAVLALTLSGTFLALVTISAIARLLSYAATCAALPILRRRRDAPPAMFRAPAGPAVAIAALVLCAWLLSNSSAQEATNTAIAMGAGAVVYVLFRLTSRTRTA
jgi:amino acid transporter